MKDFLQILHEEGMYSEAKHNKTDKVYFLNGNEIQFFSLDDEQKVRGRKRHILYGNEVNEMGYEVYKQLMFRTSHKAIFDYNPSMYEHWVYDHVETRKDCATFTTTYLDNPHLTIEQIEEIERYKEFDYEYYRVFGLGERAKLRTGAEFYHAFTRSKHVKKLTFNPELPIHLTFDFNVLPYMTMLCCQIDTTGGKTVFRFFKEYCLKNPDNSSLAAAKYFVRDFAGYKPTVFYYGDSSGKNRIAGQGNKRNFDDIESVLLPYLNSASDKVLSKNPGIFSARDFENLILSGYYDGIEIEIDESCTELIADMENVKVSIDGKAKNIFNDKQLGVSYQKYGHTSDAKTYLIVSVLWELYKSKSSYG
ncbi:MAG: phage terminase large subunit [Sediminibacterium sp.]